MHWSAWRYCGTICSHAELFWQAARWSGGISSLCTRILPAQHMCEVHDTMLDRNVWHADCHIAAACKCYLLPSARYINTGNSFTLWAYDLPLRWIHALGGPYAYAITIPVSSCCSWSQLPGPNIYKTWSQSAAHNAAAICRQIFATSNSGHIQWILSNTHCLHALLCHLCGDWKVLLPQ